MTAASVRVLACLLCLSACRPSHGDGADEHTRTLGSVEVTARLVEVPPKAVIRRELYDYAGVMKYEVLAVHRGALPVGAVICVAHYNPPKPRAAAADRRVRTVGGNVSLWREGDCHRLALEQGLEDHYMGGIVDEFFKEPHIPRFWAVWTNFADPP